MLSGPHHLLPPVPPRRPRHVLRATPRRSLRLRLATLLVALGERVVLTGWRVVDAGQHVVTGRPPGPTGVPPPGHPG